MKKEHSNRTYVLAFSTDKRKSPILAQIQRIEKKLRRPRIPKTDTYKPAASLAQFEENVKLQIETYKASKSVCK
mgnify:CR=1 FL=1